MQGILARFRAWVRVWLGITGLEVRARTRHEATLAAIGELERNLGVKTTNDRVELLTKLQEINMRLTVAKVDHPSQYQPQVYDWDTVQAIAAHALETSEAPKEEELV